MNFDEDIERKSIWTNIALFMVGIAILAFMPKISDSETEQVAQQAEEQLNSTTLTEHGNLQENTMILMKNNDSYSESVATVPFYKSDGETYRPAWTKSFANVPEKEARNYIEIEQHRNNDDLITAAIEKERVSF